MSRQKRYHVYILASDSKVLYIGITGDLRRRVRQHKNGELPGFTRRYNVHRLVYVEEFSRSVDAIAREKQLKRWSRIKKTGLIESVNPEWLDLSGME